jgi:GrxC family glutaredoxin
MGQFTEFVVNNVVLFLALIVILVLLARTWITPGGVKGVGPMQAVSLSNHNNAVFIDVRTDDEYRQGHILHAIHAPLGLLDSKLKEIAKFKSRPLIVYCRSGNRSGQGGAVLKKNGFDEVYNLSGGVMAWQSASLPLSKDKSPPPTDKGPSSGSKSKKGKTDEAKVDKAAVDKTEAEKTETDPPTVDSSQNIQISQTSDKVVVYTTRRCPFCVRAVNLLNAKGVGFKEINIDNSPELREEMEQKTNRNTVPQIFIGDYHVGGCDDMYELEDNGRLDTLLGLR